APIQILASQEPKAAETAKLLAEKLGIQHQSEPGLHEHDRSNVPHLRSSEFISMVEVLFRKPAERVLGRESAEEALQRFSEAVDRIVALNPGGNLAVVAHGKVIAVFAAAHSDRNGFALWREMGLPSFVVRSLH